MIVGLTGGIGSGKSTVAKFFTTLGVPVYDSDESAKRLMQNDEDLIVAIKDLLGEKAYSQGQLSRFYIASKVFSNKTLLEKLNRLVHPAVRNDFLKWVANQKYPYVMQESALIFENHMLSFYDKVILVTAPEKTRIERVMERDDSSFEQVSKRMAHQFKDSQKKEAADFIIENLSLTNTQEQVLAIHHKLLTSILHGI